MRFKISNCRPFGWAAAIVMAGFVLSEARTAAAQEPRSEEPSAVEADDEFGLMDVQLDRDDAEARAIGDPEEIPPVPEPEPLQTEDRSTDSPQQPGELGVRVEDAEGVIVRGVIVGAAGNKAGIRPGDRIVAIDGEPIHSAEEVRHAVSSRAAGDICTIEVERGGETKTVSAVLEPRVGYYDNQPSASTGKYNAEPAHYRRGRYNRPRYYSYRPYDYDGPRYRRYYPRPPIYGPYYGTPRFGYYDRGWRGGGLQLGPLNIWW